jgi:FkbM family methyltransferase
MFKKQKTIKDLWGWKNWEHLMNELDWLHKNLRDENSRNILEDVVLYHITGANWKIKWRGFYTRWRPPIITSQQKNEKVDAHFLGWSLYKRCLHEIGFPITIFLTDQRPIVTFDLEQYADHRNDIYIREGDIIIDGGACWGDTALYFAHLAGHGGKVYSFEFMPENLAIMDKNMDMNMDLKKKIKVIKQPLWSKSGIEMCFTPNGPGTTIDINNSNSEETTKVITTTIDEIVETEEIKNVNFIKLDIEGAELEALKGACKTIKRFQPNLALCVYHKPEHFVELARYVKEINPEYKFSLDHLTDCAWETVLYASTK